MFVQFILVLIFVSIPICAIDKPKKFSLISVKEHTGELTPYFLKCMKDLFDVKTFVETGTFLGGTTANAAEIFDTVHTIELSTDMYKKAADYLKNYSNVHRHLGDSGTVFKSLLQKLPQPILFWLDGHYSGNIMGHDTAIGDETSAILKELRVIKQLELIESIIMIDDIRLFDKSLKHIEDKVIGGYPTFNELLEAIYAINQKYILVFLGDILLAYPNKYTIAFSPIIKAMTKSMLFDQNQHDSLEEVLDAEKIISQVSGAEAKYLYNLFEYACTSDYTHRYGVGKQYILWRALAALGNKDYLDAYNWFAFLSNKAIIQHWRIGWYMAQAALEAGYEELAYKLLTMVHQKAPDFSPVTQLLKDLTHESVNINADKPNDLSVVGVAQFADSLGRLGISVLEMLKKSLKMNFITSRTDGFIDLKEIPQDIAHIILNPDKSPGNVSLFFDLPILAWDNPVSFVPNSKIKIAYTMVESTAVPASWVSVINEKFDAVAVPDAFLVDVYRNSGIKVPIFVLPCALYLEDFLAKPVKKQKNSPFVFGISAGFWERKNQVKLVEAFAEEFGNNPNILLKLHSRMGEPAIRQKIEEIIKKYNLKNVAIIDERLDKDAYRNFMSSLDCYVLLSKGEGFSITPREALALGIPCIISNNTAHKVICDTDFVRCVETPITHQASYAHIKENFYAGVDFDCTTNDARKALRDVYENYEKYLRKAHKGRQWVKQYLLSNLKSNYLTLVKPQVIKLGKVNFLDGNVLTTNSSMLYSKYKKLHNMK